MKAVLYSLLIVLVFLFSCHVKSSCELNHTGEISVTNNTSGSIEVYVNNSKVFDLSAGETKTTDKAVGDYTVKCMAFPDEWTYDAAVIECETIEINVPE